MKSWKTTAAGVVAFIAAASTQVSAMIDGDPLTNPEWGVVIASFMVLVGLFSARDNGVTSEQAGAKTG